MELADYIQTEYLRLQKKLLKEGLDGVSSLSYERYMKSPLWQKTRLWVLERDDACCVVCKSKASEVHHRNYSEDTLIGRSPDKLVSLCLSCHDRIEKYQSGEKRKDLFEKDRRLSELLSIHADIEKIGLAVQVSVHEARGVRNIKVTYVGPTHFLQFYKLSSLAYYFCVHIVQKQREELVVPMPFRRDKLMQQTGARILSRKDKKCLATVWASEDCILVRQSKGCPVHIESRLPAFIEDNKYWRIQRP